jgi:uncharacterized membrane protein
MSETTVNVGQPSPERSADCASAELRRLERQRGMQPDHRTWGARNIGEVERVLSVGAGVGMALCGLTSGKARGLLATLLGGGLIYRGLTGHCAFYEAMGIDTAERKPTTAVPAHQGCKIERTITVRRSAHELYDFWRYIGNFPKVMRHLKSVEPREGSRTHWIAHGLAKDLQWDAEILNRRDDGLIAWRSLPGGDVETAGSIRFKPLGDDRGTKVTVSLKYNPPGGKIAARIANWLGAGLDEEVAEDLRRFKRVMESGDVPAPDGQPVGTNG